MVRPHSAFLLSLDSRRPYDSGQLASPFHKNFVYIPDILYTYTENSKAGASGASEFSFILEPNINVPPYRITAVIPPMAISTVLVTATVVIPRVATEGRRRRRYGTGSTFGNV